MGPSMGLIAWLHGDGCQMNVWQGRPTTRYTSGFLPPRVALFPGPWEKGHQQKVPDSFAASVDHCNTNANGISPSLPATMRRFTSFPIHFFLTFKFNLFFINLPPLVPKYTDFMYLGAMKHNFPSITILKMTSLIKLVLLYYKMVDWCFLAEIRASPILSFLISVKQRAEVCQAFKTENLAVQNNLMRN